jgi:hypothetical protein
LLKSLQTADREMLSLTNEMLEQVHKVSLFQAENRSDEKMDDNLLATVANDKYSGQIIVAGDKFKYASLCATNP